MPELASPDTEHGRDVRPVCDGRELLAALPKRRDEKHSVGTRGRGGRVMLVACVGCGSDGRKDRLGACRSGPGPACRAQPPQPEDARPLMQPLPLSPTGSPSPLAAWRTGRPGVGAAARQRRTSRGSSVGRYKGRYRHAGARHAVDSLQVDSVARTLADYRHRRRRGRPMRRQNPNAPGRTQLSGLIDRSDIISPVEGQPRPGAQLFRTPTVTAAGRAK